MASVRKKIFLFSHDPGGANTIIPLVAPLREKGYDVCLYGKGVALERYEQSGLTGVSIVGRLGGVEPESVEVFLREERPDFLMTGTSAEDFTEKYLWHAAEKLGIPSFAILDQWINYGIRFSPWGLSNSVAYEAAPEHPFLPARIVVMDSYAKEEMARAGIVEAERILPLGQPYFETLADRMRSLPSEAEIRERWGVTPGDFVVTYVSEPLSRDYANDTDSGPFWGFTEITIFKALYGSLLRTSKLSPRKIRLIVKLHPREAADNYAGLFDGTENVRTTVDRSGDSLELIQISDLVCGMSSMMLIEAAIVGRQVLSVMIGLKRENPFVLDRRGIIRSVRSEPELDERLRLALAGDVAELGRLEVARNPVRAIIKEMEKML